MTNKYIPMNEGQSQEYYDALEMMGTTRGLYIIAQALYHGIKALDAVPEPHREGSNIEDMRLMQSLFPFPDEVFDGQAWEEGRECAVWCDGNHEERS